MLSVYFVAICRGSALDRDTRNFTLFSLIEAVQVPREALDQIIPFEFVFSYEVTDDDVGPALEFRIVWVAPDGGERMGENVIPMTAVERRNRVRAGGIRMPSGVGVSRLYIEWRRTGTQDWARSAIYWPLDVTVIEPGPNSTPPTSA